MALETWDNSDGPKMNNSFAVIPEFRLLAAITATMTTGSRQ